MEITKEYVENYFKDANTIKNRFGKVFKFTGVICGFYYSFCDKESYCTLYDEKGGFAEIID